MIKVTNLTKKYGSNTAISGLNFEIERGKIYGFLGPNGAGKSTTMNIITGCLAQTEGTVTIDGHDVYDEPITVKKMIGYLPELPPLYMDMTPKEYLSFVAEAKGMRASEIGPEVERVMEKTSVTHVAKRLIKNLSKGYRQRVGIAMALLGDPEIIILDEPTVGLDPRQIIEIRELIKSLGEEHTVILSSHILSEIQEVCEHVIIISNGVVVADDTMENIVNMKSDIQVITVIAATTPETALEIIDSYEEITHYAITEEAEGTLMELTVAPGIDMKDKVFFAFAEKGIALRYFSDKKSLEEVYLGLTEGAYLASEEEEDSDEYSELSYETESTEEPADEVSAEEEGEYTSLFTAEEDNDEGDL